MDELVRVDVTYGHVEIKNCYKPAEEGGIWFGGYSIKYDRNGNFVSQTEPFYHFRVYAEPPNPTLWQKLKAWMM